MHKKGANIIGALFCYYLDFLFLGFATSTVFDSFSLRFSFNDKAGFFLSFLDIFTT